MLSAGAPPPKFGTRLEVLLDRAAGHASSPLTPNSGATLYAAESPSVSNLGAGLQQISLVTDTAPESARPAGFNAPAPRPDSEPVHEPSALALFAEHADRLRIWGRLDEADALEARLKGALGGLTSSDFGTLLAMPEPQTYDMDFAIPNFTMEEEHEPCSGVWGVHEPSPTEPPAFFAVPNDQDLDLAPLYADDETQLDPEEEERERLAELERQQKKESASIATKWTAGKAWGDHWVKDVTGPFAKSSNA